VSASGIAIERLIKPFEGCKLKAYPDPGTGGDPWTIGWGATGEGIGPGVVWTQDQADNRLLVDVLRVERAVRKLLTVSLADHQLAALISFAYNCGLRALGGSTLLRLVNAGDFPGASAQFPKWSRAGGRVMAGLVRRRAAERACFDGV
jgi:lysozyme